MSVEYAVGCLERVAVPDPNSFELDVTRTLIPRARRTTSSTEATGGQPLRTTESRSTTRVWRCKALGVEQGTSVLQVMSGPKEGVTTRRPNRALGWKGES
jgi:hypothetical protein